MPIISFNVEYEQEEDGKWLAELHDLPGELAYGQTPAEAILKALAFAPRVIAEKLKHTPEHL